MRTTILVVPVFAFAMGILYAATAYERYDPYTLRYRASFDYVRGLKEGDQVWARGFEVGRVESIKLVEDEAILEAAKKKPGEEKERVYVVLKVLPELMLPKGITDISVEPLNPFGAMYVEIQTGIPDSKTEAYDSDDVIEGVDSETSPFVEALRRRDPRITEGLTQLRRDFEDFRKADSSLARALYESGPAADLDESFTNYELAFEDLARNLRDLEEGEGGLGAALSDDPELAEELRETLDNLAQGFSGLGDSLRSTNRGEGSLGRWLNSSDGGYGSRELVANIAESTDNLNGEGSLAAYLSDADAYREFEANIADLARGADEVASAEDGSLINDPHAARELDSSVRSLEDFLREAASEDGVLGDADSSEALEDALNQIKELTGEVDEAIRRSVASQPVNTIHGAVFSIF